MKYKQERKYLWTAIICMTLVFTSLFIYLLLRDNSQQLYLEREVCHNETRPYSEFWVEAVSFNVIGSGEGDRWEIVDWRYNDIIIKQLAQDCPK